MRVMFVMAVDSVVDIITNSSSELFVLERISKMEAQAAVAAVYPGYRSEYNEIVGISELSIGELEQYVSYASGVHEWGATRDEAERAHARCRIPLAFDELFKYDEDRGTYDTNVVITADNRMEMINRVDPDRKLWFMFSIGENPNYEMQEALECIATKYHLG